MTIKLENLQITTITPSFQNQLTNLLTSMGTTLTPKRRDRIWTALKRLPYLRYSCIKAPDGALYFMGKTQDIIAQLDGRDYNIGPYLVCISAASIRTRQSHPIHLFPQYNPKTTNRHLHHGCYYEGVDHPLMATPDWCWASIGPSYISALSDIDIVDMFRLLYIFIIRLNWSSPLRSQWQYEAMEHGEAL